MKTVRTLRSGLIGWQDRLQSVYSSYDEFIGYCSLYSIHLRLGYKTVKGCWNSNPVIEGSTISRDLRRVK